MFFWGFFYYNKSTLTPSLKIDASEVCTWPQYYYYRIFKKFASTNNNFERKVKSFLPYSIFPRIYNPNI